MASLLYSALMSLDGFVADEHGRWDWAVPDEEVHAFVNDLQRRVGTHLYGRRMYEVLRVWETMLDEPQPDAIADYARVWQAADKIVYSRTLEQVTTARTRLERRFDPGSVRAMKASAERDLVIGGPELASQAFAAGLVDEVHLFLAPAIVGGGTRALPDGIRLDLELVDERRFASGMLYVGYRVT
jgi:dihydrofolate reductase